MSPRNAYSDLLKLLSLGNAAVESQIVIFRDYLIEVNQHVNLVSRNKTEFVIGDLIYDSLAMLPLIEYPEGALLLDIGSGAGFPWIIHKIVRPDLRIVTVDSNQRKIEFQKSAARKLGFSDCQFFWKRVEEVNPIGCDFAISKAFGSLELICALALPHIKPSGNLILPRIAGEAASSEYAGFKIENAQEYQSSSSGRISNLLTLKKI